MTDKLQSVLRAATLVEDWEAKSKEIFKETYPDYYARLTAANNANEFNTIKASFQRQALSDINTHFQPHGLKATLKSKSDAIETPSILLKSDEWQGLKDAKGEKIKHTCEKIIGTLQLISRYKEDEDITAQLWIGGLVCFLEAAITICVTGLKAGATTIAAALLAVSASTAAMIAVSVAVIALIIIPFLYFMHKPANCILLVTNNTDEALLYEDSHFAHGKFSFFTEKISGRVVIKDASVISGFFGAEKTDYALIGSQCGFSIKGETSHKTFNFGAVNPLTGSNGCWCGMGNTAKNAAESVKEGCVEMSFNDNSYGIRIRAHSTSGSIAYFHVLISKT